jgi:hypothetical protein
MTLLDRLRELEAKATPGPWTYHDREGDWPPSNVSATEQTGCNEEDDCHNVVCSLPSSAYGYEANFYSNGPLIAETRNALPKLLEALEVATEALKTFREYDGHPVVARWDGVGGALAKVEELLK